MNGYRKSVLIPRTPATMHARVADAATPQVRLIFTDRFLRRLDTPQKKSQLVVMVAQIPCTREHFLRLNDGQWLNDELVNVYFMMMQVAPAESVCVV